MHFLVTGGAGYIGSHIVKALLCRGDAVTVLDNFSTGHRWAVAEVEVIECDLRDLAKLKQLVSGRSFHGVFHFAATSLVRESSELPLLYYQNNVVGTANLVEAIVYNRWNNLVFSSTAALFGNPVSNAIDERHPKQPINVYGRTKLINESLLDDVCSTGAMNASCLRYFNAAGASHDGAIGECHKPETHLIPNVLRAASGQGPVLNIFGNDYDTPDGTCIRDYIHVNDLAKAHLLAMDHLLENQGFHAFNLGNGSGYSVLEVLLACEAAVGRDIPHQFSARRAGDPVRLVADSTKAQRELGWTPELSLEDMVSSAWRWEQNRKS